MEKEQQELIFKLSMYEQQLQQLHQQLQAIEQGIDELSSLDLGLDELKKSKDKEVFAPVGKGIFIKSKILSENLIVDVGGKKFVKKSVPETKNIINAQINKLQGIKKELELSVQGINQELMVLMNEAQKHDHSHNHEHEHNEKKEKKGKED